mgnify:CR=1 FL=1
MLAILFTGREGKACHDPDSAALPVTGAWVITAANRKFGWWAIPLAAALAFSRLYLFVHFPSDILSGALIGAALGLAAVGLSRKLPDKIRRAYTKKKS